MRRRAPVGPTPICSPGVVRNLHFQSYRRPDRPSLSSSSSNPLGHGAPLWHRLDRLRLFAPPLGCRIVLAASLLGLHRGGRRPGSDRRRGILQRSDRAPHEAGRASWRRRRSTPPAGSTGGRSSWSLRDDYADPDSAVFVAGDLYESGVSAVVGPSLLRHHARRRAGLQRRRRSRRRDLAVVLLARGLHRRRPHLPGVPQRPGARRGAGALGPRAAGPRARGRALPERSVRPRHPPDLRRAVRRDWAAGSSRSTRTSATSRTSGPTSIAWRATGASSSSWWPATAAKPRRCCGRRGGAALTVPILGGDGLEGIEGAGALAEGVYLTSSYFPTLATAANRKFVEAYRRKFPDAGMPNQPAAATYDAIYLLARRHRAGGHRSPGGAACARRGRARRRRPSRA